MSAPVKLQLLGPPRVNVEGAPLEVDTRKAIALLALLAMSGRERSRDALAVLLWPDHDQVHARGALRRTLSALNKALRGRALVVSRTTLAVDRTQLSLDVDDFRALVGGCVRHHGEPVEGCSACTEGLTSGVGLYRDDFLAGFGLRDCPEFDDWTFFEAEGLRRELLTALQRLVRACRTLGETEAAIGHARRWVALDPLHEPAHQQLMGIYVEGGLRSAALGQYRECVALLDRELGVAPLEETTALYRAIREGRRPRAPSAQEPRPEAERAAPRKLTAAAHLPLVGRDAERAALARAYEAIGPHGRLLGIEGEAGVGKTRLAEDFLASARAAGAVILAARSHEDEAGIAFGALSEVLRSALTENGAGWARQVPGRWLAEAARVVPELEDRVAGLPQPPSLEGAAARGRFLEGLTQVVLAATTSGAPGIVFLDDLQWADESSLEVLTYLVRRLRGRPLCVVATWRVEEPSARHRLRRLVGEAQRDGVATVVRLPRLTPDQVTELVAASRPGHASGDVSARLFRETEGLPFFVVEYLAALDERGGQWALPQGIRDVLLARVASVPETARQLLSAAAVIGRSFGFDLLRSVSGRSDEESVAGVEELTARGLLVESAPGPQDAAPRYDFSHDKLRGLVYDECSLARRRLLHRRAAETMLKSPHDRDGDAAGVVANHLLAAGEHEAAAHHFRVAGERARAVHANDEALDHFRAALGLGHPDVAALHEVVGDLHTLAGDYRAALTAYEAAAARGGAADLAALEHKIGSVHHRRGDWSAAEHHLGAALATVGAAGDEARRARVEADRSLNAHRRGATGDAEALARRSLELAEAAGDDQALAQAYNMLGVLANARGDHEGAQRHLARSLALAEALDEPAARVAALNNLASSHRAQGRLDEARAVATEALEGCVALGDRHREAALHNNLADILHASGDAAGSMAHLKRAVSIFADVGEPEDPQPEVWKLFEW